MPIKIDGFSEVFKILRDLFSAVKSTIKLSDDLRREMKDSIAATAELIDETLVVLKQHLTSVISELRFGNKQRAAQMISELSDFNGWETKYRQFQLCDALREATWKLESKGLYKLLNNITFPDPDSIKQRMFDYIGGEVNAARSVSAMLIELSKLANSVSSDSNMVIDELEDARTQIGKWRQDFIDLEMEIRSSI